MNTQGRLLGRIYKDVVHHIEERSCRSVLDIGAGSGRLAANLGQAGVQVTAVDIDRPRRRSVRSEFSGAFVQADAAHLPFGESFDCAVLSMVLHSLSPDACNAVWREANRVVREGGILIVCDFSQLGHSHVTGRLMQSFFTLEEWLVARAGSPHYKNYKMFRRQGGLEHFLGTVVSRVQASRRYLFGNIQLSVVGK